MKRSFAFHGFCCVPLALGVFLSSLTDVEISGGNFFLSTVCPRLALSDVGESAPLFFGASVSHPIKRD